MYHSIVVIVKSNFSVGFWKNRLSTIDLQKLTGILVLRPPMLCFWILHTFSCWNFLVGKRTKIWTVYSFLGISHDPVVFVLKLLNDKLLGIIKSAMNKLRQLIIGNCHLVDCSEKMLTNFGQHEISFFFKKTCFQKSEVRH